MILGGSPRYSTRRLGNAALLRGFRGSSGRCAQEKDYRPLPLRAGEGRVDRAIGAEIVADISRRQVGRAFRGHRRRFMRLSYVRAERSLPRSYGPSTPREKGSALRGVLLARSGVVDREAHGCWTGAIRTSENAHSPKVGE